ncbi:MAG: hypothetical protein AAF074_02255 [Pseudomonadota bacterium]
MNEQALGLVTGPGPATGAVALPDPSRLSPEEAGIAFEASFLAEMLRHAGFGEMPEGLNGGSGEAHFAPFYVREVAQSLAQHTRFGIAEMVAAELREAGG